MSTSVKELSRSRTSRRAGDSGSGLEMRQVATRNYSIQSHTKKSGAGGMAQWLQTFTTQTADEPQSPHKPGGCLLTSTGTLWHVCLHMCTFTHTHTYMYTHHSHTCTSFIYTSFTYTSFMHSFIHTHTHTTHSNTSYTHIHHSYIH